MNNGSLKETVKNAEEFRIARSIASHAQGNLTNSS